jgi:hypothetical protein
MKPVVIVTVGALAAVVLVLVAGLVAIGKDPTPLMTAVSLVVTPVLGALLYGEVREARSEVSEVRRQTNGSTSELLQMVRALTGTPRSADADPPAPPVDGT